MASVTPDGNIYRLSRRGRKLYASDDQRLLQILPKDISERTWAEIIQREKSDLLVLDIREQIVEDAIQIGFDNYMQRQEAKFTSHCAAQALIMLMDWHFYCHDPGEDPNNHPPCHIPKREQSWVADKLPEPSPKDTLVRATTNKIECDMPVDLQKWPSNSSLDMPIVEKIPEEYWFPGKVQYPTSSKDYFLKSDGSMSMYEEEEAIMGAASEVVQQVTDYDLPELKTSSQSLKMSKKQSTSITASLQGAGDSALQIKRQDKLKFPVRRSSTNKSRMMLPPIDKSRPSLISDCHLRTPRLETFCEVSSEKFDSTPPTEVIRRKGA